MVMVACEQCGAQWGFVREVAAVTSGAVVAGWYCCRRGGGLTGGTSNDKWQARSGADAANGEGGTTATATVTRAGACGPRTRAMAAPARVVRDEAGAGGCDGDAHTAALTAART